MLKIFTSRYLRFIFYLAFCLIILGNQSVLAFEIFGWKFFAQKEDNSQKIVDPINYDVMLRLNIKDKEKDKELEAKLKGVSLLLGDKDKPAAGTIGLVARARTDQARLLGTLYDQAHYAPVINIYINGKPFDQVDVLAKLARPVKVAIVITPGRVFSYGTVRVISSAGVAPLSAKQLGLIVGQPAKATQILDAESRLIAAFHDQGYPLAKIEDRQIVANHATYRLNVVLGVNPGRRARFGQMNIKGLEQMDEAFVRHQADVPVGQIYRPKDTQRTLSNLRKLGVFDQISLIPSNDIDGRGNMPLTLQLHERKRRFFGASAAWSTTKGGTIGGYWGHRNLFGHAEQLLVGATLGRIGKKTTKFNDQKKSPSLLKSLSWEALIQLKQPGFLSKKNTLTSRATYGPDVQKRYRRTGFEASLVLTREITDKLHFNLGISSELSSIEDGFGTTEYGIVSLPISLSYNASDDRLSPTKGYKLYGSIEPSYDWRNKKQFLRALTMFSVYQAIDQAKKYVLAGQIETGMTFGGRLIDIPADKRYYLGGGGTVRGFDYLSLGPKSPNGKLVGGRSFWRASLEARIGVTDSIGVVPFVDIGMAYDRALPKFTKKPRYGVGIGLRYKTPVGPLRVDVAIPLKRQRGESRFAIYAGIGQSF